MKAIKRIYELITALCIFGGFFTLFLTMNYVDKTYDWSGATLYIVIGIVAMIIGAILSQFVKE